MMNINTISLHFDSESIHVFTLNCLMVVIIYMIYQFEKATPTLIPLITSLYKYISTFLVSLEKYITTIIFPLNLIVYFVVGYLLLIILSITLCFLLLVSFELISIIVTVIFTLMCYIALFFTGVAAVLVLFPVQPFLILKSLLNV